MKDQSLYKQQIVAAGGTITIPVSDAIEVIECYTSGAVVLVANVNLTYSGTPRAGQTMWVLLNTTNLTIGANTVTVFGEVIDSTLIEDLDYLWIKAIYSTASGKFIVTVFPNFDGTTFIQSSHIKNENVTTAKIKDANVTHAKLQAFTARGYLLRGGAAGTPEEFNAVTSGQLVMGNGTDVTSIAMSGDVTINGSGVTTIGAGKVTPSMLSFSLESYLYTSLSLTSVQILALNTTPQTIIAAPGSGKWIEIISATTDMNFDTAAYATNTTLQIINEGSAVAQLQDTSALIATVDKVTKFQDVTPATAGQTQITKNSAVQLKVATGDPTAGSGTLTVHVIYRIVEA